MEQEDDVSGLGPTEFDVSVRHQAEMPVEGQVQQ